MSRALCVVLFLSGFIWCILQLVIGIHAAEFSAGFETVSVAKRLAETGQFADPFPTSTGPTAHVAPVYPALMAAAFTIFRPVVANLIITVLNAGMLGLEMCLLAALSGRIFGSVRPGVIGAVLLAAGSRLLPQHDALFSGLLMMMAAFALTWRAPAIAGVWAGISVLANPVTLLPTLAIGIRRGRRFVLAICAIVLVFCLPWIIRNWMVLGAPSFVRSNFGLELWISNFDAADPELIANPGLWRMHPSRNPDEARLIATLGETAYHRAKLRLAIDWIETHPMQFVKLSAMRGFYYWLPSLREGWPAGVYRILFVLALAGAWLARRNRTAMTLALASIAYSLPYLLVQTDVRYPIPMLWVSALLAGYGVNFCWSRFVKTRVPAVS